MKIDTIVKTKTQNLEKNLFNWTIQSHFYGEDKEVNINNDDHFEIRKLDAQKPAIKSQIDCKTSNLTNKIHTILIDFNKTVKNLQEKENSNMEKYGIVIFCKKNNYPKTK